MEEQLWYGSCQVAATEAAARKWKGAADEAVADVVVQARSREDMEAQVLALLAQNDLQLIWLEDAVPLMDLFARKGMNPSLAATARRVSPMAPVAFSTFRPLLAPEEIDTILQEESPQDVVWQEQTWEDLFAHDAPPLWAVIDGVNCREIAQKLSESDCQHACLYTGLDPATRTLSPWLVRLEEDSPLTTWLQALPADQHWGILLHSQSTLKNLRSHLRRFTMLWTPANDQAPVYFRFYDPRVLIDLSRALELWKLHRFMGPSDTLFAPASPEMTLPESDDLKPIDIDETAASCAGRLIAITTPTRPEDLTGGTISISPSEFAVFSEIQAQKSARKLARDMAETYDHHTPSTMLPNVDAAIALGQRHSMTSSKQIKTLTKCTTEFGVSFPEGLPKIESFLNDRKKLPWQKQDALEAWLPFGVAVRKEAATAASGEETISSYIERKG